MSSTVPSREVVSADVPDPAELRAKFVYYFFTPDEGVNETGKAIAFGRYTKRTQSMIDDRTLEREVPRFVVIDVKRVFRGHWTSASQKAERWRAITRRCKKYNRYQPESSVSVPYMSTIAIEDPDMMRRLRRLVGQSIRYRLANESLTSAYSQTDLADILNGDTPPDITGDMILRILSSKTEEGVTYVNSINEEIVVNDLTDQASTVINIQVQDKFLADFQKRLSSSPFSPGSYDSLMNQTKHERLQAKARVRTRPEIDMSLDYDPEIKVLWRPRVVSRHLQPWAGTCGYIIDKYEIHEDGTRTQRESIFLDGVMSSKAIDSKVKYGASYSYTVSAMTLVRATFDNTHGGHSHIYSTWFLIKSRPSPQTVIKCIERVPPPPPDGIFYRYDYDTDSLIIDWQFPITPQRDVKKFQVFRRKSIDEGFTLLAQYDFNDSEVLWPMTEVINSDVDIKLEGSYTSYTDSQFDRSGDYIYTVVSVDAHNLSSNYGAQTRVKFNSQENKIDLSTISPPDAPKQYPNFFVSPDSAQNINTTRITEDVMLDSGHKTMRIYFDPEYLKIENGEGFDQKFLTTTGDRGSYKFQILNLDRQKSRVLTLEIEDKITGDPGWLHKNNTYGKMKKRIGKNTGERNPGMRRVIRNYSKVPAGRKSNK